MDSVRSLAGHTHFRPARHTRTFTEMAAFSIARRSAAILRYQPLLMRSIAVSVIDLGFKKPALQLDGPMPPKRPAPPFAQFLKEYGRDHRLESGRLNLKELGEVWQSMDENRKEPYWKQYHLEQEEYKHLMADVLDSLGDKKEEYLGELRRYRNSKRAYLKKIRLRREGLVKPRRTPALQLYISETLKGTFPPGTELQVRLAAIHDCRERWKSLDEQEKEKYIQAVAKKYEQESKAYEERKAAFEEETGMKFLDVDAKREIRKEKERQKKKKAAAAKEAMLE